MLVAAVASANRIDRAAIPAMAGRASKFLKGMPFQQIDVRVAREGGICALGHAQIGLRQRDLRRHVTWIGAHVARLAAIDESGPAEIVQRSAGRVHVDLDDALVEILHAPAQTIERC